MVQQSPGDCIRAERNWETVVEDDDDGEEEEGEKEGKKREISNYRDFLFRNSIPNTIVLAFQAVDRTLISPGSPIVPLETFRNRSLSVR